MNRDRSVSVERGEGNVDGRHKGYLALYRARCSCGWFGDWHGPHALAYADAYDHRRREHRRRAGE